MKYAELIDECNPAQSHWEINALVCEIEKLDLDIQVVLEIGVHQGGSLAVWARVFEPSLLLGINETDELRENWKEGTRTQAELGMVFRRSQDWEAKFAIDRVLKGRPLDFLFIDGGHTFSEVETDFLMYSSLVRDGGVIGFHDVHAPEENGVGVPEFWRRLTTESGAPSATFRSPDGTGTGLLYV